MSGTIAAGRRRPRVWLASCAAVVNGSVSAPDDAAVLHALDDCGVDAGAAAWDDPSTDWGRADLVVIRSTWDYQHAREAFVAWCEEVEAATALANPAAVVRANTDKRYLLALEAAGVPIVPTHVVEPGQPAALPEELSGREVVVKPAVSAGGEDTARYPPGADGPAAHLRRLAGAGRVAMVQPYQPRVDTAGETALVFVDGEFRHALRKAPRLPAVTAPDDPRLAPESIAPTEPTSDELAVADRALAAAGAGGLLYARVDLVGDAAGRPRVLELELTEPSLFLAHVDGAAAGFAEAIAARLPR